MDLFTYAAPPPRLALLPDDVPEDVARKFLALALEVRARGFESYSSDAILHRIRWHAHVERGDRDFKCNNNWTAPLARWAMQADARLAGFFELRRRA